VCCSDRCRYAARDRGRHVQRGTRREATCRGCGGEFVYESTTRPRLYCFACSPARGEDPEGYNRARRVVHAPRACVECGGEFTPNRAGRLVCSDRCGWARKRRLKREREAA
jgi:hypothetical protein